MQAAIIREHGGLSAIRVESVPTPTFSETETLIQVKACAVNHMDLWARKGVATYKYPLPLIPGCDIAGIVVDGGHHTPGTEVIVAPGISCGVCTECLEGSDNLCKQYGILGETRDGGCAEFVAVPTVNVIPKPSAISWTDAAAFPLTFLTAWHMLVSKAQVRAGDTVLVHAGGSGVGSAAIQIARLHGARVFTTAGTDAKLAKARALGADIGLNYKTNPDWSKKVYQLTNRRGVDIVIEHVGAATWDHSIRVLRRGGRLVTCGATTGGEVSLHLQRLFFKNLEILGSTMGTKAELHRIVHLMASGDLKPMVDQVLPLADIQEAHRILEAREAFGKVVITP